MPWYYQSGRKRPQFTFGKHILQRSWQNYCLLFVFFFNVCQCRSLYLLSSLDSLNTPKIQNYFYFSSFSLMYVRVAVYVVLWTHFLYLYKFMVSSFVFQFADVISLLPTGNREFSRKCRCCCQLEAYQHDVLSMGLVFNCNSNRI